MGRKGARKKVGRKKAARKKTAGNARNARAGNAASVTKKTSARKSTQGKQRPRRRARREHHGDSPFLEISHPQKRAWLTAYSLIGSKARAAEAVGINRRTLYTPQWRDDEQFQEALERARLMAIDVLEDEAHRRAVEGWDEPAGWYKGEAGGVVRRYSDTLLIFRLKGELPQKYAERLELRGGLATLNLDAFPDDLLERVARGEHPMSVLMSALERGISRKELGLPPREGE